MASLDGDVAAPANDVHAQKSATVTSELNAPSCPLCQSIFAPMPVNRTCTDASIAQHWCTCTAYKNVSLSDPIILDVVQYALQYTNDELQAFDDKHPLSDGAKKRRCAQLKMRSVSYAGRSTETDNVERAHLVVFQTTPGDGWFEATVLLNTTNGSYHLSDSVSRLNSYASQSSCMPNEAMKKYCYCL